MQKTKPIQQGQSGSLVAHLNRGTMSVRVDKSDFPADQLFGFAERNNPKRAFLFVSKVLGRHIPARPKDIGNAFASLANKIPQDLPGPVVVIGMAETAVGLGAGVHRTLSRNMNDVYYICTTRHPVSDNIFCRFDEEHSHASSHLVHLPVDERMAEAIKSAGTLVLVDDEASTGKTFINLIHALENAGMKDIQRIITVTLTDWSQGAVKKAMGDRVHSVSLLEGQYVFDERIDAPLPAMPEVGRVAKGDWSIDPSQDWGRMGVSEHLDTLAPEIITYPGERVLIIGTGEYVWRPFLLAERLERAGADVRFSSTTRSPIALGHSIEHVLNFSDNYGLGIPNFAYNVQPGLYDRIIICTETPSEAVDPVLVNALKAEVVSEIN